MIDFEWDAAKAISNERKHGLGFTEASTVFSDPLAITFDDPDHSIGEERFVIFGKTSTDKYIIVAYTWRENIIRLISARLMSKAEQRIYEDG